MCTLCYLSNVFLRLVLLSKYWYFNCEIRESRQFVNFNSLYTFKRLVQLVHIFQLFWMLKSCHICTSFSPSFKIIFSIHVLTWVFFVLLKNNCQCKHFYVVVYLSTCTLFVSTAMCLTRLSTCTLFVSTAMCLTRLSTCTLFVSICFNCYVFDPS
jgi:hypothetical protein